MIKILKKIIIKMLSILNFYPYVKTLLNKKMCRTKVEFKGKVRFLQETIFYGRGRVEIGECTTFGFKFGGGYRGRLIELQPRAEEAEIIIGRNVATNNGLVICCNKKVTIGDDTLIGSHVTIMDHSAHGVKPSQRRSYSGTPREVHIGKNVWIGSEVFILPGTEIGDNSIVGAGAVVSGKFPANVIIMGNPAKIIKEIKE